MNEVTFNFADIAVIADAYFYSERSTPRLCHSADKIVIFIGRLKLSEETPKATDIRELKELVKQFSLEIKELRGF